MNSCDSIVHSSNFIDVCIRDLKCIQQVILWPLLALPAGVFSKGYFTMWVIIAMIWGLIAAFVCVLLPIWEAREAILGIITSCFACRMRPGKSVEEFTPEVKDVDVVSKNVGMTR